MSEILLLVLVQAQLNAFVAVSMLYHMVSR